MQARTNHFHHAYDYTHTGPEQDAALAMRASDAWIMGRRGEEGTAMDMVATASAFTCRDLVWC